VSGKPIRAYLEATPKKAFAVAIDWPGWSRAGKTPELALEALLAYAPRYAAVAREAGIRFATKGLVAEVVHELEGDGATEFGVPGRISTVDREPTDAKSAPRLARLVEAAWTVFDRTAAHAPAELRKGPRGGGRDTAKIVDHVVGADHGYSRELGVRLPAPDPTDRTAVAGLRTAMLEVLGRPSDGGPLVKRWTQRYAARRIAWHALDHAWEIEDRTEPG
jgi:hypothetical protein